MIIGGLQKNTLIDFPNKIACTVFLAGCNFRCPWCYSAELVLPEKILKQPRISEKYFFDFLRDRKGLLEGVVLCGGEPTINKNLLEFIKKIKDLEFLVKLDTNGSNPVMLKELIDQKLIDYVAMDIKTSKKSEGFKYENVFIEGIKMQDIERSVDILKQGKVNFEFRTTVVNTIHKKQDFLDIAKWIGGKNIKYYLQNFRAEKTIDSKFENIKPYSRDFYIEVIKEISPYFEICQLRDNF
jgi:pyruvate formate lyase activating enzyme